MLRFLTAASADMEPLEKHCVVMFDEMAIDSRLVYDRTHDVVRGPHTQAPASSATPWSYRAC